VRVGIGYDVHRLVSGRDLVLGGKKVPFNKGLSGHSDADVLTHAIMDALLGAAGLKDIGSHFPPDDPEYKDISSLVLLGKVREMLSVRGFEVANVDATIVAERPRLSSYIDDMRDSLSRTLGIPVERVMVKATTTEGLGFAGMGKGMAACAIALIDTNNVDCG